MTGSDDQGGGFRWNLKPSSDDEPDAEPGAAVMPAESAKPDDSTPDDSKPDDSKPDSTAVATQNDSSSSVPDSAITSPPDTPVSFMPKPAVASVPESDWDVPTAASPVIARSVFPLPPPAGAPALLPPPYVPPQLIPPPYVPPPDNTLRGMTEALGPRPSALPDAVDGSPRTESPERSAPATSGFGTSDIEVLFGGAKFIDYSSPAVQADSPTTAMRTEYVPPPPLSTLARPPLSMTAMARPSLPVSPTTALPATTVFPAGSLPPIASLPFGSLPPLQASALALYVPPNPAPAHAMPRQQKILLGVAAGLVALLALIALFLLGTRIGGPASAPDTAVTPAAPPATTPTVAPATGTGPVAVGDHAFDQLLGGECLTLYESPWQETYTVVDCAQPHPAQMLGRATLPDAAGVAYPATADLQASTTLACTAATVVDYASAGEFDDIEISASFPSTAEQWAAGDRTYYCFASRSGGGDLTGSIAVPAV